MCGGQVFQTLPVSSVVKPITSCDDSQTPPKVRDEQTTTVGAPVPATLALALGVPATFGAFTPGIGNDYNASSSANVVSTAGDGVLSVADPSSNATGRLVNGTFSLPAPLKASAASPLGTSAGAGTVGTAATPSIP